MIELVLPDERRWPSWVESMEEFGDAVHLHGYATFGFEGQDLGDAGVFQNWLGRETGARVTGQDGFVPATVWWIVDEARPDEVLGSIQLRHELNDFLLAEGGHIGYGIRPSARGRGVATAALLLCLEQAVSMGLSRVLIVCDIDNEPSRRTILAAGGMLETVNGTMERYWIDLG
ncbi:MAG: GNAT family N-acetyltransferase [Actinomycetota bacterium]